MAPRLSSSSWFGRLGPLPPARIAVRPIAAAVDLAGKLAPVQNPLLCGRLGDPRLVGAEQPAARHGVLIPAYMVGADGDEDPHGISRRLDRPHSTRAMTP